MEAKDTVIHYGKVMIPLQEERETKQAEISFKAGIKEVVDWLKQYAIHGGDISLSDVLADMEIHSPFIDKRN